MFPDCAVFPLSPGGRDQGEGEGGCQCEPKSHLCRLFQGPCRRCAPRRRTRGELLPGPGVDAQGGGRRRRAAARARHHPAQTDRGRQPRFPAVERHGPHHRLRRGQAADRRAAGRRRELRAVATLPGHLPESAAHQLSGIPPVSPRGTGADGSGRPAAGAQPVADGAAG